MPTKYTVEDAPTQSKYTVEDASVEPAKPGPVSRFFSSAWAPIASSVSGLYHAAVEGPQTPEEAHFVGEGQGDNPAYEAGPFRHPLLMAKRIFIDPAKQQAELSKQAFSQSNPTSLHPTAQQLANRQLALGHGLAAVIPGVGPWAANVGQTVGEQAGTGDTAGAAGTLVGNAALAVAPKVIGKVGKAIPKVTRGAADIIAGTGPKVAEDLATKTAEENAVAQAKADAANATLANKRAQQVQQHFEKTQQVRQANEAAQALQSRKAALNRGVEQLDPQFQEDLKATEKNVRDQANEKYNTVREAVAGETVPSSSLAEAVKTAEGKIQGSSENLKIFRDILSKSGPDEAAEVVTDPTAGRNNLGSARKGEPMYDIIKGLAGESASPVDFSTLQGYYSELGDKLSGGNLPGDVYQAMKSLHGSIADLMQKMADSKGVGDQLKDARSFYRDYMGAFRDHSSPLYKAMNATERGKAVAALKGADQSGIETLARYNPDLARRANTIRGYQAEANSITSRPPAIKPEPVLPPKPQPSVADVKKIGLQDIRGAKAAKLEGHKGPAGGTLGHVAAGAGGWHLIHSALAGNPEGMITGGALAVAPYALAKVLKSPAVVKLLSEPTPADIAAIPPELRGDLPVVVKAAQAQGIKVHPAFVVMAGATNAPQQ